MRNNSTFKPSRKRFGGSSTNSRFKYAGGGGKRRSGGNKQGVYIDPNRFINKNPIDHEAPVFTPEHTFADMSLHQDIQRNLTARGFATPTPIQDQAIPVVLEGKDVIGLANTGTGKTAAFSLPLIHNLLKNRKPVTALVVAPTRELALQIDSEFRAFARGLKLYSTLCVGGTSMHRQISELRRGPHVVIGTPGRLKDLVQQGVLKLNNTNVLVLDEVDRMLDMGFIKDVRFLTAELPSPRQTLCFSATMTNEVERVMSEFVENPVTVSVGTRDTSSSIEQDIVRSSSKEHKLELLIDMLKEPGYEKVIIFGQTKFGVERLSKSLMDKGITAQAIHGNKSQPQRQRALKAFRGNQSQVLVATDVAARGLDIPNVSHVINFDQPNTYDDYIHRIGRTGRAGQRGKALTFV